MELDEHGFLSSSLSIKCVSDFQKGSVSRYSTVSLACKARGTVEMISLP